MGVNQPIIRGIQAVGAVSIRYKYNGEGGRLTLPQVMKIGGKQVTITTGGDVYPNGVPCAGFRLDGEFLRANPQIESSFMIPILGGGAVALTNNNRSGVLNLRTTRVSNPSPSDDKLIAAIPSSVDAEGNTVAGTPASYSSQTGAMIAGNDIGVILEDGTQYFDITTLLQAQQAQSGGDALGSTIYIDFQFNGLHTVLKFEGCTVANIDPVGLSGNDAVDYNAKINYLNWRVNYSSDTEFTGV